MAEITKLSRLIAGLERQVDLSTNTLVVLSLKVGGAGGAGTELTKAILDRLVSLQSGADVDATYHTHDGRYFTETEISSNGGSALVGDAGGYANFTPTAATVRGAFQGIDAALIAAGGTSFSDAIFEIYDNGDVTKIMKFEVAAIATATTRTITVPDSDVNLGLIATAIQSSEKGLALGVATLDAGGKIPISQLPSSVFTYEGTWNASTNTPTLADGDPLADAGMVYLTSVAGTVDFGSGPITFAPGDWVVYSGTIWQKSINSNAVVTVNGYTGVVVLTTTDISEGTNLYFTTARARTAAVQDAITDGVTDIAPSQNAVFDALAGKQAASAELDEAVNFFANTDIIGAEAEQLTNGSNADNLHTHASLVDKSKIAGVNLISGVQAVRLGRTSDTNGAGGRVYLADMNATVKDNFYVIGLTTTATTAGGAVTIVKSGPINSVAHGFTPGDPIFLGSSGNLTNNAPSADGTAVVRVGFAIDSNNIEVQVQVMGVN